MKRDKVLLVSFAPRHSSAVNRVHDCANGQFDLEVYQTDADKVKETLASRIFSTRYPALFLHLLRSDAAVFWPWGLDACMVVTLAALFRPGVRLLWDITDINVNLLKSGWKARILRMIERLLIKRADALLLSSPTFYDAYYRGMLPREKVTIIENLLRGPPPAGAVAAPPAMPPCVIVYSGIIRSAEVVKLMCAVAAAMPDEVVFHVHGYLDRTLDPQALGALIAANPNVHDHGAFTPADLPAIYAKAHLSWGFVDTGASINEQWLLTNRIYNGVSFGRPVLANAGTTSGAVVEERRIGLACAPEVDAVCETIRSLMADDGAAYRALRAQMPPPSSAYLDGEYPRAIEALIAARRSR